jgi:hypothetical protein
MSDEEGELDLPMKLFTLSLSLAAFCLVLTGCGQNDNRVQARFKDFSKEKEEKLTPQEREYVAAARPFVQAIAARDYAVAFGLLSPRAKARMSLNQFTPADDDAQYLQNESKAVANVTPELFTTWMAKVEARHGLPSAVKNIYVHNTEPLVLSGRGNKLDVLFAIGAMPDSIPNDIRKASLRGQFATTLTPAQMEEVAKHEGMSVEELRKNADFAPYFNFKLVLLEEEGELRVGYFEFLPPSILD